VSFSAYVYRLFGRNSGQMAIEFLDRNIKTNTILHY
jgi:hypothetical protein